MEIFMLNLNPIHGIINVELLRKDIKNVHLKVSSNLKVKLSVPRRVDTIWIENTLFNKKNWIAKQLDKYKQAQGFNSLLELKNGTSTQFLGKDVRILKKLSDKNYVEQTEKKIIIHLIEFENEEMFRRLFANYWRQKAHEVFTQELDMLYKRIIKKYNIAKPSLAIRKMRTLWGSCTKHKEKITLNEYLLKADRQCIQYVVLHELTHLFHIKHNTQFYTFLTIHMPNWQERKKRLDKEVVQGL